MILIEWYLLSLIFTVPVTFFLCKYLNNLEVYSGDRMTKVDCWFFIFLSWVPVIGIFTTGTILSIFLILKFSETNIFK